MRTPLHSARVWVRRSVFLRVGDYLAEGGAAELDVAFSSFANDASCARYGRWRKFFVDPFFALEAWIALRPPGSIHLPDALWHSNHAGPMPVELADNMAWYGEHALKGREHEEVREVRLMLVALLIALDEAGDLESLLS